MAIWLTGSSKVIVQGITGGEGTRHTRRMVVSGTNVVGGVNPKKAGSDVDGIPVFATVEEAMKETGADVSVVFVPPAHTKAAAIEGTARLSRLGPLRVRYGTPLQVDGLDPHEATDKLMAEMERLGEGL